MNNGPVKMCLPDFRHRIPLEPNPCGMLPVEVPCLVHLHFRPMRLHCAGWASVMMMLGGMSMVKNARSV